MQKVQIDFGANALPNQGKCSQLDIINRYEIYVVLTTTHSNRIQISGLLNEWSRMRQKLDNKEITQDEYNEWKQTWDDGEDVLEVLKRARRMDDSGVCE